MAGAIRQAGELRGAGWETGRRVRLKIVPGAPGSGIVINGVPATPEYARAGGNCTMLVKGKTKVKMVEHFLSACCGLGVSDIVVMSEEMPIADGSALPFVHLLQRLGFYTGIRNQKRVLRLSVPVGVEEKGRFVIALPVEKGLRISCIFSLPGTERMQFFSCQVSPVFFVNNIAPARTFGPGSEALVRRWRLRFKLEKSGSWLFPVNWRFPDEPCRHKVLDLIGDLALIGWGLQAEIVAFNPGHRLNLRLVRMLAEMAKKEVISGG